MNKHRCKKCGSILFFGILKDGAIQAKCHKCKTITEFSGDKK